MPKLTILQRSILASTASQDVGLAIRPAILKPAQAAKIVAALTQAGLAKEIRAKTGAPVWREDKEGRAYALKILKAGREAIVVEEPAAPVADKGASAAIHHVGPKGVKAEAITPVVAGPKSSLIVGLMRRPEGATIKDLIAATGWLPHTTRAALSGLRKKGVTIDRAQAGEGGASVYRIPPAAIAA